MFRIIGYELYKLLKCRGVVAALIVLLFTNAFLVWVNDISDQKKLSAGEYRELSLVLRKMEPVQALDYLNDKVEAYRPEMAGHFDTRYYAYREMQQEAMRAVNYEAYLTQIFEAEKKLESIGFFQSGDEYSKRSAKKTSEVYKKLVGTELPVEPSGGVKGALGNSTTSFLLLLMLYICCIYMFQRDRNNGIEQIERTTALGRKEQMAAKACAIGIVSVLLVILFYGYGFIRYAVEYGFGSLDRPLQSVAGYIASPFSMTVGAYFIVYFATKCFGAILFSVMFARVCIWIHSTGWAFFVSAVSVAVLYACHYFILDASWLVYIKYINPYVFLETEDLYSGYHNLRFFSEPVDKLACIWGMGIVLSLVLLRSIVFSGRKQPRRVSAAKRKRSFSGKPIPKLFVQETYKILIYGHGLAILCIGVLEMILVYCNYHVYPDVYELQYRAYMHTYEGEYNEEKAKRIAQEQEKFEECEKELADLSARFQNGLIDEVTYKYESGRLNDKLSLKPVFMRFLESVEYVKNTPGAELVYDTGYEELTKSKSLLHIISYLVILITLAAIQLETAFREKNSGMHNLTHSTVNGREVLKRCDLIIHLLCGWMISVSAFAGEIFFIRSVYGLSGMGASAVSLAMYEGSGMPTILAKLLVYYAIRVAVVELAVVLVTLAVYPKSHSPRKASFRKNQINEY